MLRTGAGRIPAPEPQRGSETKQAGSLRASGSVAATADGV